MRRSGWASTRSRSATRSSRWRPSTRSSGRIIPRGGRSSRAWPRPCSNSTAPARRATARRGRGIAVTEAAFGPDHPTLVASLTAAANAELHLGNLAAARALLDRASPILAATNLPQLVRADFLLARACAARAADARADARSLATEARTYAADAGASGARVLAAIDAWLAETPGR